MRLLIMINMYRLVKRNIKRKRLINRAYRNAAV